MLNSHKRIGARNLKEGLKMKIPKHGKIVNKIFNDEQENKALNDEIFFAAVLVVLFLIV